MLVRYPEVVLGADVIVPGVLDPISLRIPAGTQSGQVFLVKGRGLPRVNASGVHDLHVRVQVWTPDAPSADEKQLLQRLLEVQDAAPAAREKGFWQKMKDALGA